MDNQDKHKPLSAEELFALLDDKSNDVNGMEDMDDFEKEAFEGFTNYSSPQKAKELTEELNISISKRVEEKGGTKKTIIWFSAAASIALIILVSVFFFNQTKQESDLALNESKDAVMEPSAADSQKPAETIVNSTNVTEDSKPQNTKKAEDVFGAKDAVMVTGTRQIALSENESNSSASGLADLTKDDSGNRREGIVNQLNEQSVALTKNSNTELKQKEEKSNLDNEESEKDKTVALESKSVSDANVNAIAQGVVVYQADGDYRVSKNETAKKASKEKVAAEKSVSITTANHTAVPAYASGKEQMNVAYYDGGEVAIKDFVLNYLKEHAETITIKGKYKVIGNINAKGELKVNSITQISKEYCEGCSDKIKEALNTMKKWHSSSVVEFTLNF